MRTCLRRIKSLLSAAVLWIIYTQILESSCNERTDNDVKGVLDGLLNASVYDRQIRPSVNMSEPTRVGVEVVLVKMLSVDESKMQLSATIFLRQVWTDHRLTYDGSLVDSHLTLGYRRVSELWVPDLNFINENEGWRHQLVVPNLLLRLWPNGTIVFSQRLTIKFHCVMDLHRYPFDNQTCQIRVESYGFDTSEVELFWNDEIQYAFSDSNAGTTDFVIQSTTIATEMSIYKPTIGNYTSLVAYIRLKRYYSYFMLQTFVPCILVVAVSWASFWLHIQATPARASLGILTVLTMTSLASGFTAVLPRVPYVKAMDVWLCACLIIVVLAFVEFAIVHILTRLAQDGMTKMKYKHQDPFWRMNTGREEITNGNIQLQAYRRRTTQDQPVSYANAAFTSFQEPNNDVTIAVDDVRKPAELTSPAADSAQNDRKYRRYRFYLKSAKNIEIGSRIGFPLGFLIFNGWYWLTYAMNIWDY